MNRYGRSIFVCLAMLALAVLLSACGGSTGTTASSSAAKGVVKLDVTDAPALDYAHVYVTVTALGFHTSSTAGFSDYSTARTAGWNIVTLATPKTVDLVKLTNGTMYADLSGSSLFDGITLPVGTYQQLRIFIASTEDAPAASASSLGLTYNNEVQLNGDTAHYPLRVPSADSGIKVVPESPVEVTEGATVNLALDFNLAQDVVEVAPNGVTEFMLKPRLGYFDMAQVGAITGAVSFSNLSTSRIEVKAQQVKSGVGYRMVRRMTAIDKTTGAFTLYPLPIFGNATTAVYDLVVRGRNVETAIVKGITVHKGTNPSTGVNVGTIALLPGTEFTAQLGSAMHPSGAWMNFYQSIGGDPVPFEMQSRHLDPYTGKFGSGVGLSTGPVQVATYLPGQALAFTTYSSAHGQFSMVADAGSLYSRGGAMNGIKGKSGQHVTVTTTAANVPQATGSGTINGVFDTALMGSGMGHGMGNGHRNGNPTEGQVFVVHDGMIIDSTGTLTGDTTVSGAMATGGTTTMRNIPSGVAGAMYSMYAIGWGNGTIQAGSARGIDLRNGSSAMASIKMK